MGMYFNKKLEQNTRVFQIPKKPFNFAGCKLKILHKAKA